MIPRVPKVVLTGGSLSGKTRLLTEFGQDYKDRCVFVPEAATYIIEGGYKFLKENYPPSIWGESMQRSILTTQLEIENAVTRGAPFSKFKSIVCDRGLLDGAGYHGEDVNEFEEFMHDTIGLSREEAYTRYDKVIMLNSIANLGEDVYDAFIQNNPSRIHSCAETLRAEEKIRQIWSGHPRFVEIPVQKTYDELKARVEVELIPYFGTEREFKFKLASLPEGRQLKKINIEQYYLNLNPEIRLRRTTDEITTVQFGVKHRADNLELEVKVPNYWYDRLRDDNKPLIKDRYLDSNGVIFDTFDDFVLAEIEVSDNLITGEWLVEWIKAEYGLEAIDVSNDENYYSKNLIAHGATY